MTADDFLLLSVAFGLFVFLPALVLWGIARLSYQRRDGKGDRDIRRGGGTQAPGNEGSEVAARSRKEDDVLHRRRALRAICQPYLAAASCTAGLRAAVGAGAG